MGRLLVLVVTVGLVAVQGLAGPAAADAGSVAAQRAASADAGVLTPPRHDRPAGTAEDGGGVSVAGHDADCAPWSAVAEDVTLEHDTDCTIVVVGDDVTVDLAGHRAGTVIVLADRVTVRDGTIRGAVLEASADARLLDVVVHAPGLPFAVEAGLRTVVDRSRFVGNVVGISFFFGGAGTVTRSVFEDNELGLVIGRHDGVTVRDNRFTGNDVGLTVWDEDLLGSSDNLVEANHFAGNVVGAQLLARSAAHGNRFAGNHFRHNEAAGLFVMAGCLREFGTPTCAGQGTHVADNLLLRNGRSPVETTWFDDQQEMLQSVLLDDGLLVVGVPGGLAGVTVSGNRAIANADLGIEADGVVDGGGNLGRANGDPRQCVGVSCTSPGR